MRRLVLFQLVAAGKALAAGGARVRLLSRVHAQVGLELVGTAKALPALLADVLLVRATPRGAQDSDRVGGTFRLDFHRNRIAAERIQRNVSRITSTKQRHRFRLPRSFLYLRHALEAISNVSIPSALLTICRQTD